MYIHCAGVLMYWTIWPHITQHIALPQHTRRAFKQSFHTILQTVIGETIHEFSDDRTLAFEKPALNERNWSNFKGENFSFFVNWIAQKFGAYQQLLGNSISHAKWQVCLYLNLQCFDDNIQKLYLQIPGIARSSSRNHFFLPLSNSSFL